MPAPRFVGSEVKRLEDPRLIRGQAQYLDDLVLAGMVYGWVVRSPHAHARVVRIDVSRATKQPGVHAVFTARRSEEHTSELQSHSDLVCRLLLEKKKKETHAQTA